LERIQTAIHTYPNVMISTILPVPRNLTQSQCNIIIISEHSTTVTIATQWLTRKETRASYSTKTAGASTFIKGTETLGCILDNRNLVFVRNRVNLVKICTLTVQGDRNDCFGFFRDPRLQQARIHIESLRVDINVYGFGAKHRSGLGGSDVAKSGSYNLIASFYA